MNGSSSLVSCSTLMSMVVGGGMVSGDNLVAAKASTLIRGTSERSCPFAWSNGGWGVKPGLLSDFITGIFQSFNRIWTTETRTRRPRETVDWYGCRCPSETLREKQKSWPLYKEKRCVQ